MFPFRSLTSKAVALPGANRPVEQIVPLLGEGIEVRILLTGSNPCAGARSEGVADALAACGVRCVISPHITDPFGTYCVACGILPIVLANPALRMLMADAAKAQTALITVDLEWQEIVRSGGQIIGFRVDPLIRRRLLTGRAGPGEHMA